MDSNAKQLHHQSLIIDGLNASYFLDTSVLAHLHQGGVTAANATVAAWHSPDETHQMLDAIQTVIEQCRDFVTQAASTAEIKAAKAAGKTALILGFQDSAPIGSDLKNLHTFYDRGVRIIQLTYNTGNRVGHGCLVANDPGLTGFGHEVVREMNRLGVLIDLSHCGSQTTLDAIAASEKPVAFTHTSPKAFCNHPRNKSDEALAALVEKGGVVGAMAFPVTLTGKLAATLDDYLDSIDYFVKLVGVEHVSLGPDFMEKMPEEIKQQVLKDVPPEQREMFRQIPTLDGLESVAEIGNVTAGLLAHGYETDDVRKIIGMNWLRLYREVWEDTQPRRRKAREVFRKSIL